MAGVTRKLTKPAFIALFCIGVWAFGLLFMWIEFHFFRGVWTIGVVDFILPLALLIAAVGFVLSCFGLAHRKSRGLPVFREDVPSVPKPARPDDPLSTLLWDPPAEARVQQHAGRRVVVLADGSAVGEMMNGSARRFSSLDEFRAFVGS